MRYIYQSNQYNDWYYKLIKPYMFNLKFLNFLIRFSSIVVVGTALLWGGEAVANEMPYPDFATFIGAIIGVIIFYLGLAGIIYIAMACANKYLNSK